MTNLRLGENLCDGEPEDIYVSGADLTCTSTCAGGRYANCTRKAYGDGIECWANCGNACYGELGTFGGRAGHP